MAQEIINCTLESDLAPVIVASTIIGGSIITGFIIWKYNKIDLKCGDFEVCME